MFTSNYDALVSIVVILDLVTILALILSLVVGLVINVYLRLTKNAINNCLSIMSIIVNNLLLLGIILMAFHFAPICMVFINAAGYPDSIVWFLSFTVSILPTLIVIPNFIGYITYRNSGIKRSLLFLLSYSLFLFEIIIPSSSSEIYLLLTSYILLLLFFMLFVNMAYTITNYHEGFKSTVCKGRSMCPTLKPNSTCFIRMKGVKLNYSVGDIIEYIPSFGTQMVSEHVLHRLVRREADKLITKGDNNVNEDTPIKETDIVGKAIAYVDPESYHLSFLTRDEWEIKNFSFLYSNKNIRTHNGNSPNSLYTVKLLPYFLTIVLMVTVYIV